MAEDLATLLAVCEKASQSKFPVTIDPVAVLPVVRRAADLIEQQAASLAELNQDTSAMADEIQRLETERAIQERRADQAERALAEAVEVMRPFAERAFQFNGMNGDFFCSPSVQVKHLNAARAFVAQHGSDSREGK